MVDARSCLAHPAIDAGFQKLIHVASELGCAGLAIRNYYNFRVLGYHVEYLPRSALPRLGFTNVPASIKPVSGKNLVIGTNPSAISVPNEKGGISVTIDQSGSVVTKSEIKMHIQADKVILEGWGKVKL